MKLFSENMFRFSKTTTVCGNKALGVVNMVGLREEGRLELQKVKGNEIFV